MLPHVRRRYHVIATSACADSSGPDQAVHSSAGTLMQLLVKELLRLMPSSVIYTQGDSETWCEVEAYLDAVIGEAPRPSPGCDVDEYIAGGL